MITEGIRSKIRPEIVEEQFGFVTNSGTTNAIFTLNRIIENAIQVQKMYTSVLLAMKRPSTRSDIMN